MPQPLHRKLPVSAPSPISVIVSLIVASTLVGESKATQGPGGTDDRVVAWNDLGMHCIDPDFSVFSILPPFNNVNAQVVHNGQLVDQSTGITVTYEGVADSTGSINTTSIGKTNFWDYVDDLFGVSLPPDMGLAGNAMPGPANVPQDMHLEATWSWFQGPGIPATPLDDNLVKNPYPLMRVTARDAQGQLIATTVTTVPVSQEIACAGCHGSGSSPFARPDGGWAFVSNPLTDDRWNILRLHDERQAGNPTFDAALATAGYDPLGLEATAQGGTSVFCARCHSSNALPGSGITGIGAMTSAMHGTHANVVDESITLLDDIPERASCYNCHPGAETKCMRGAMGTAIGSDGQFAMHCQSCHGSQSAVGDPARVGWLEEPTCANCHTGTATNNNGQIRYTSAFDTNGELRTPVSTVFATTPDVPAQGFSLYRFSTGHGGLQCSACHGSPHAIYPTTFANDNAQSELIQGHAGTLVDCTSCHASLEDDEVDGAHGMHPVSQKWVQDLHKDEAEHGGVAQCLACHGSDARGTVLSYAQGDRSYSTPFGMKQFWKGFRVGCYACHNGPNSDNGSSNVPPVVPDVALSTPSDVPLAIPLTGTDANNDALTFRIVSQPDHGTAGLTGDTATYFPEAGFLGDVTFTYAAWDGKTNSNLGVVTVTAGPPLCGGTSEPYGFGCPGADGTVPSLQVDGCPEPGQMLTLTVANGPGGVDGLLAIGAERDIREPWSSCVLRVRPLLQLVPFVLSPGGSGEGAVVLSYTLPPSIPGNRVTFQAFVRDTSLGQRGTFSNAWEVITD